MDEKEKKIKELRGRMDALAGDIQSSLVQLNALRSELNTLSGGEDTGTKSGLPNAVTGGNITPPPSAGLESFIGLRLIHLVGIVVLVTGISIGVKYAMDRELISESLRIILAYAAGIFLFVLSVRLKAKYHLFSAILFAGSMASIYFTTYAASVYYQFFPALVAFVLMVALTGFTAIRSIQYDLKEIAIIGMIGAYGIPFLVSANAERIDLFFSYILLINIGVVFISLKKSWKLMGQLALLLTWILFNGWALLRYAATAEITAVIFMCAFYLLFIVNAVAFPYRGRQRFSGGEIWQLLVNNLALYIAAILVLGQDDANGSFAVITGYIFLLNALLVWLASLIFPAEKALQRWLTWETLLLLLSFIALQWDGVTVTLLWIVVAVLLFTWGVYGRKAWARLASVFLIAITLLKLLLIDSEKFSTLQKIAAYIAIGILLLAGSFYYQRLGLSGKMKAGEDQLRN